MKVLLVNGSPHERGCTFTALNEVGRELSRLGIEPVHFWIGSRPVGGCQACGGCARTGNGCVFRGDAVEACAPLAMAADGLIVGSPVYYAGPNGQLTSLLDRLFYSCGRHLKLKPGSAVVSCRRGGASATYDRLLKYFEINSMPVVTSQYWNSVHGSTPDQVRQDEEGLQTMRTLARNMAWMLRMMEATRGSVSTPEPEPPIRTNFIR